MKTLTQAIRDNAGAQAAALSKHLGLSGVVDWKDCTKARLNDFRDAVTERVAPSSARTYIATLKAILARYEDEGVIPCRDFRKVLTTKGDKPVKTFLSMDELNELTKVRTKSANERFVLYSFLVGAFTGMRVSDARAVSPENIIGDLLTYTSIKTRIQATIPCGERVRGYIEYIRANDSDLALSTYNNTIRRLCRRAGLTERVKIHKAGRDEVKAKWECVSSHTARISFATNLAICGTPIIEIARMMGHSGGTQMTERYVAQHKVTLNEKAMAYLQ